VGRRALAALALAGALTGLAACGGDGASLGAGDIGWVEEPQVVVPETLPKDRILTGTVRNDAFREAKLVARELRLVDADGDEVESAATFNAGFGRSYYSPSREPLPEAELIRVGQEAVLQPGDTVPLTVSWSTDDGSDAPVAIEYEAGSLPVP